MSSQLKYALLLSIVFFVNNNYAQSYLDSTDIDVDSITKELDLFLAQYTHKNNRSYFHISTSINNTQLSLNNLALNSQQINPGITVTPSIEYVHKSGFNVSYNHFLLLEGEKSSIVQHGVSAGYTYSKNKKIDFGFYYTHFIKNTALTQYASPYKHDLYAYGTWNDFYIIPSLAIGYAVGDYKEFKESVEQLVINRPFRGDTTITFTVYDSLSVKLRDFTSTLSLKKKFIFEGRKANRYIAFTPSALFLLIKNNYNVEYKSASAFSPRTQIVLQNQPRFAEIIKRELGRQFPGLNETRGYLTNGDFNLQSIGINLDLTAYFGKFYINPRIYFDYYLLSSDNKFNAFFSLQTGVIIN
jgi:hypothetical protein